MRPFFRRYDIAFYAPYPDEQTIRDGYFQRVAAIDDVLCVKKRVYFSLLLRRGFVPVVKEVNGAVVVEANLFLYCLFFWLFTAFFCRVVYFHSVIEATKGLPLLYVKKFFLDLHGVVPEEMSYVGNNGLATIFGHVERVAVARAYCLISVTRSLLDHIDAKYQIGSAARKHLVLPIFPTEAANPISNNACDRKGFIYAGGTQPWQNVGKMLEFSEKHSEFSGIMLVGSIDRFNDSYRDSFDRVKDKWHLNSVSPDQVASYYQKAQFGFLVRSDSIVNRVACPTKLVEYLKFGVVPVLDSSDLGDFKSLGMRYLSIGDFDFDFAAKLYSDYASQNYDLYQNLIKNAEESMIVLVSLVEYK